MPGRNQTTGGERMNASQLMGLSVRVAELMGKPHIGCHYEREDYRSHKLDEGARCALCGRKATDAHHIVPRSKARGFTVNTPIGKFVVMTPLFALCRSCHNDFHAGARYEVSWEWKDEQYKEEWWNGHTLAHICWPHFDFLWQEGRYVLRDKKTGEVRVLNGLE